MCFQSSAASPQAAARIWCRCTNSLLPESRFKFPPYHGDCIFRDYAWLYWCPGLTLERWQEECRLVEERFSLFRPFAESPFFGFRGIVARSGSAYVTVAVLLGSCQGFAPKIPPLRSHKKGPGSGPVRASF